MVPVHLPCLARRCLFVDLAPSDKGKCVLDGAPIGLGEPRLLTLTLTLTLVLTLTLTLNLTTGEPRLLVVVPKHNGEADSPLLLRLRGSYG